MAAIAVALRCQEARAANGGSRRVGLDELHEHQRAGEQGDRIRMRRIDALQSARVRQFELNLVVATPFAPDRSELPGLRR